jgi:tRNA(fMet)-specific endonuclease VapC
VPTDEDLGMSIITLSELLEEVHYAETAERAQRRQRFIDRAREVIPVQGFDIPTAIVHARLRAEQRKRGRMIGAHDLIIAATAMSLGWDVLTFNPADFREVEGLGVREVTETA